MTGKDPVREILLEELENVTQAIGMGDNLNHWLERLQNVNHALQSLENTLFMTYQEKATLRQLLEFHDNGTKVAVFSFDTKAHQSLLAKVRPFRV